MSASYNEIYEQHGAPDEEKYNLTNAFHNYNQGNGKKFYKWYKFEGWKPDPDRGSEYGKTVYDKYIQLGGGN